jgi:hypothetical protein
LARQRFEALEGIRGALALELPVDAEKADSYEYELEHRPEPFGPWSD